MKSNSPFWHNECAKREKQKAGGIERGAGSETKISSEVLQWCSAAVRKGVRRENKERKKCCSGAVKAKAQS